MMDDSNTADIPETLDALVMAAERILSGVIGDPIHFTSVERLSEPDRRNLLLRCTSSHTRDFPSQFILKKVQAESYKPGDPDSWDTQRFFNDWVGSEFLSALGADHGPRFYGGHRELGFILLEDLGHHRSLVEPLLQKDATSAETALFRYIVRLGKMHADTIHRRSAFEQLFHAVNRTGKLYAPMASELEPFLQRIKTYLEAVGVLAEAPFLQEMTDILAAVTDPGPFLAFIHGDPCPDNVFDTEDQLRLIDFEFAHFGHALLDATYPRMMFPTCWCANRLPPALVTQMESRYRAELIQGCPEAQEDSIFERALVAICGFWLWNTLGWTLESSLKEDQDWGIASHRQRILVRLETFVSTSEEFNQFPAVRGTASRLLELLGNRWPECLGVRLYPAFQNA